MKFLSIVTAIMITTLSLFLICRDLKKRKENTITTQSGNKQMTRMKDLEYEILQEGSGISPKLADMVTVHYTGWLNKNGERGQQFDSSFSRNEPFSFKIGVGRVIKGWDEGVMTMKIGEKRRLFIPAHLAYGDRAVGTIIPANSDLIFDVELLQIN